LTLYDTSSATATKLYTATDPAAQAYAHAYDGYLAAAVDKTLPPTTAATGSSPSSTASNSDSGVSGGTIAEAVIGVIAGLALVAGLLAFLLRRRRRRPAPYTVAEMPGESALGGYGTKENRAEMPANYYVLSELPGSEPTDVKVAAPGADKR
jgi:LPXTG-motif cell wall-anchored protein